MRALLMLIKPSINGDFTPAFGLNPPCKVQMCNAARANLRNTRPRYTKPPREIGTLDARFRKIQSEGVWGRVFHNARFSTATPSGQRKSIVLLTPLIDRLKKFSTALRFRLQCGYSFAKPISSTGTNAMPKIKPFYVVVCDNNGDPYAYENDFISADVDHQWSEIVRLVASCEWSDVSACYYIHPKNGTCEDKLSDLAQGVDAANENSGEDPGDYIAEWVENILGYAWRPDAVLQRVDYAIDIARGK
jgi:hypothetical protein